MAWLLLAGSAASASHASAQSVSQAVSSGSPLPIDQALGETAKGHGSVSIAYQNTYVNGRFGPNGISPIGSVRFQSISLDLDYFFADRWSVHLGIPFIEGRYDGQMPHCPTSNPPQCKRALLNHPESQFLDDGNYHGAWQDWRLGVAYHANVDDFLITPSITAHIPSHHYTFFAQSAVGQGLWKVEAAIDLAHQFELTNLYYRVSVGRVFAERTLGQSIDHNKLELELGYFLDETWTIKAFGGAKKGNGYTAVPNPATDLWYHHDQRAPHNFASVGVGLDYHVNDKYVLSTTLQKLVWGQLVFNYKYSLDMWDPLESTCRHASLSIL